MTLPSVPQATDADVTFEREKWVFDCRLRERELAVKEREQSTKEGDLALKQAEQAGARWKNPLVVAILAAAVAGSGNALVAYLNGTAQVVLETQKSEQSRILEMIKTGNPDRAAENLKFLVETGLIRDPSVRSDLLTYLNARKPGTGPTLPPAYAGRDLPELVSKFEGQVLKPFKDALGSLTIGSSHVLTPDELRSGKVVIDGKPIEFSAGITKEQAERLLESDLAPIRKEVSELVTVKLTKNQEDALVSFVFSVGPGTFKRSTLLKKLNEGQYDQVPTELMKYAKVGGRELPGLVRRREAEAELWSKK
jgi:GH24 family phage-related lysozyme (muramidase)